MVGSSSTMMGTSYSIGTSIIPPLCDIMMGKKSSVSTLSLHSLQKMKLKNILSLGILAMSSCRFTHTTREVMIQQRRIVFSPGEGLNYLIRRVSGVLNPVNLPQTSAVPPQSYREFRSPGLIKAVFWSITLLVSAQ